MKLIVLAVIALAACARGGDTPPDQVPLTYKDVSASPGHAKHVGKVPCAECHGDKGFAPPPPSEDLCARCHATVATPLHPGTFPPTCQDCHAFGADHHAPVACMRCHERAQGAVHAVGAHGDQPCTDCHQPHQSPSLAPKPCTQCHEERATPHAGLRGCIDCHAVHESELAADRGCVRCHAKQPASAAIHVDDRALTAGHQKCTQCHQPHKFGKTEVAACRSCHRDQPVIAESKHALCTSCHAPHADTPRACTTCHDKHPDHPGTATGNACTGCHPVHTGAVPAGAKALACTTCHPTTHHATAPCLDCHEPHGAKPVANLALCARCHADRTTKTAGTGHAECATCHPNAVHGPRSTPPACTTCHPTQLATAPLGHQACTSCHEAHEPRRAPPACATCHADKAKLGHGAKVACAGCHRPHGPDGPPKPPACETCHDRGQLPGLHRVTQHATCTTCHGAHEVAPRRDRASCLACHRDRVDHEPAATACTSCHPFAN